MSESQEQLQKVEEILKNTDKPEPKRRKPLESKIVKETPTAIDVEEAPPPPQEEVKEKPLLVEQEQKDTDKTANDSGPYSYSDSDDSEYTDASFTEDEVVLQRRPAVVRGNTDIVSRVDDDTESSDETDTDVDEYGIRNTRVRSLMASERQGAQPGVNPHTQELEQMKEQQLSQAPISKRRVQQFDGVPPPEFFKGGVENGLKGGLGGMFLGSKPNQGDPNTKLPTEQPMVRSFGRAKAKKLDPKERAEAEALLQSANQQLNVAKAQSAPQFLQQGSIDNVDELIGQRNAIDFAPPLQDQGTPTPTVSQPQSTPLKPQAPSGFSPLYANQPLPQVAHPPQMQPQMPQMQPQMPQMQPQMPQMQPQMPQMQPQMPQMQPQMPQMQPPMQGQMQMPQIQPPMQLSQMQGQLYVPQVQAPMQLSPMQMPQMQGQLYAQPNLETMQLNQKMDRLSWQLGELCSVLQSQSPRAAPFCNCSTQRSPNEQVYWQRPYDQVHWQLGALEQQLAQLRRNLW